MTSDDPPTDWFEFWVRFIFGAIAGALIGIWIWLRAFTFISLGWIAIPVGALVFGFITLGAATDFGDRHVTSSHDIRDDGTSTA
jgi:hypothetical protein